MARPQDDRQQRRTLLTVLGLNAGLAAALGIGGVSADSSALLANALDNASDAAVYLISFLAIGRAGTWKRGAARASGLRFFSGPSARIMTIAGWGLYRVSD